MNRRWSSALIVAALIGLIIFVFRDRLASLDRQDLTELVYLGLVLVLVGGGGALAFRGKLSARLRDALVWILIAFGIMGLYAFRDRFAAILDPGAPQMSGEAIELRRAADGHFWAQVEINGVACRMMIDTGASTIALTPSEARRIGIDPSALRYSIPVSTALGQSFAAPIVLDSVRLGAVSFDRVNAAVMREESDASLLGMNFLNRFGGYEVRGDAMVLHPRR